MKFGEAVKSKLPFRNPIQNFKRQDLGLEERDNFNLGDISFVLTLDQIESEDWEIEKEIGWVRNEIDFNFIKRAVREEELKLTTFTPIRSKVEKIKVEITDKKSRADLFGFCTSNQYFKIELVRMDENTNEIIILPKHKEGDFIELYCNFARKIYTQYRAEVREVLLEGGLLLKAKRDGKNEIIGDAVYQMFSMNSILNKLSH